MTQSDTAVYGRKLLKEMLESGVAQPCRVLRIGIDQEGDELEKLLALVQAVKGYSEWPGGDEG